MLRKILAISLATLAFSIWGFIWYATIFDDIWQVLISKSEAELIELAIARGPIQDMLTLLISLIQVIGIYIVLGRSKASSLYDYIATSLILSVFIVLPALGNATLFAGTPLMLLLLDFGHFCFGYAGIALTLYLVSSPKSLFYKQ